MKKKFFLVFVVTIEILLGTVFLIRTYRSKISNKVLGTNIITVIDKSKAIVEQNSKLKYYWTLEPGEWKEQPDWLPYEVTYHINNDGLRDPHDYEIEKPEDTFRIITLGDSYTYGHHVNAEDNWTEMLETKLNDNLSSCKYKKFEVINLGLPGYDIQYIVQRYKEYGQKYHPDLILWFDPGYGFTRHTEITEPLIEKCRESSSQSDLENDAENYHEFARCQSEAYKQINKDYSAKELSESILNDLDIFTELENTDNTIMFFYKDIPKEHQKILDSWKKRYEAISFANIVPNQADIERLADGHPNRLGHESITNSIIEHLYYTKKICE